jgi:hypothetical protein
VLPSRVVRKVCSLREWNRENSSSTTLSRCSPVPGSSLSFSCLPPLLDLQLTLVGWDFSASEATIFQATKHKGPVRGLDFNGGKTKQILASGSSDGEVRRPSSYT